MRRKREKERKKRRKREKERKEGEEWRLLHCMDTINRYKQTSLEHLIFMQLQDYQTK